MIYDFENPEFPEGEECPLEECNGELNIEIDGVCCCHINPPCSACVDSKLRCDMCGWEFEEE